MQFLLSQVGHRTLVKGERELHMFYEFADAIHVEGGYLVKLELHKEHLLEWYPDSSMHIAAKSKG